MGKEIILEEIGDGLWREKKNNDDNGGALITALIFAIVIAVYFGTIVFTILASLSKGKSRKIFSIIAIVFFVFHIVNSFTKWLAPVSEDEGYTIFILIANTISLIFSLLFLFKPSGGQKYNNRSYRVGKLKKNISIPKTKIHKEIFIHEQEVILYLNKEYWVSKIQKKQFESYTEILIFAKATFGKEKETFTRQRMSALIKKGDIVLKTTAQDV